MNTITIPNAFTYKNNLATIEVYGKDYINDIYITIGGVGAHIEGFNSVIKLKARNAALKELKKRGI